MFPGPLSGCRRGQGQRPVRRRCAAAAGAFVDDVGGIVKHLRWVEVAWFHQVLGANSGNNRRQHDRASEFQVVPQDTVGGLVEDYRAACARSRSLAAPHDLDTVVPHYRMGEVSLRWIYVHLIEETARHAGHLDILREQIDAGG